MAQYNTKQIRNIALAGHGGSGKTSLAEAMLFVSGGTDRLGNVPDGNTVCDYDAEEQARKFSLSASLAHVFWKDVKINIIDTPGYLDFEGEVVQGARVADSCVICVDGNGKINGYDIKKGESYFVPAGEKIILVGKMRTLIAGVGV